MTLSRPRSPKMLIIGETAESRTCIQTALKGHDISTVHLDNTSEYKHIIRTVSPDLIIVGPLVSERDCKEITTNVQEIAPDLPIIILTGGQRPLDRVLAVQSGAWDCMSVFAQDLVRQTILQHLKYSALARENAELRKSEQRYHSIYENLQDVYFEASPEGTILEISPSVEKEFPYTREELIGTHSSCLYANEDERNYLLRHLHTVRKVSDYEVVFQDKDGSPLYCSITAVLQTDAAGVSCRICGNIRNIAVRKMMEKDLREREGHYRSLVANIPVGICRYTPGRDGTFIMANPATASMLGYASIGDLMRTKPSALYMHKSDHIELLARLYRHGEVVFSELLIQKRDGSPLWVALSAYLVKGPKGSPRYIDMLIEDISQRKEAEEKVRHLAFFDALTDLPNRSMLLLHLNQAIAAAARRSSHGGIIYVDLDRFKIVNDSLGHDIGDIFLQKVAERLRRIIRAEDTVSRIGSDEFAALFADIAQTALDAGQKLAKIGEKIRTAMTKAFLIEGHELYITATIGIALFPKNHESAEEVLRHASTAANRCKKLERNRCMFYLPDMQEAADQRLIMEKELRGVLDRNELQVFFQPQVDASGLIIGAEALVRWQHPNRGFIPPMEFIPIAEETGLILQLGEWVLFEACRLMTLWKQQGIGGHLQHIAVNISPWQFRQPDFTARVKRVLAKTGVDPSMLTIEITEGVAINNLEDTIAKILELKEMHINFSIDDFGTGYSSLSYLHRLPLDQLKIDRSFTQGLAKGSRFASIVSTIIILAGNLGLAVIAEGVETETELNFLLENNCNTFQGYYFSRPLSPADFQNQLKACRNRSGMHRQPWKLPAGN
ncbi:MAG: EAL domain-containing protein [Desulfocapsaceae bacterium]|nr:EAL domain-containing protein [Desulfocapsaceae bacterium]